MTGDGRAHVQDQTVHGGSRAACLQVSNVSPSRANLTTELPAGTRAVSADGWFTVTESGPDGNDVPYFRFFTGSHRFVDIYRYNATGQLWLRTSTPDGDHEYTRLTTDPVELDSWHRLQMRVVADGPTSTVKVWLDGNRVFASDSVATTATTISSVMLGSGHYPQAGAECIDDVIIRSGT